MTGKTDGTSTWTYTWDPDEDRLLRVQGPGAVDVTYTYDSWGRMLTRTSGGVTTTFEWDLWICVKETTGSTVTRYIAPQGVLHSFERGAQVYQVHTDGHNGSVRAITDSSGAVVAHYEFDAWGNQLSSTSPFSGGFNYLFVGDLGVRFDAETGLHYMSQRWYDELGRFMSRDKVANSNPYAYAKNNPVNRVDPLGLLDISLGGWTIRIRPGDPDPVPSSPHAHIVRAPAGYENWARPDVKIDLLTGDVKRGQALLGNINNERLFPGMMKAIKDAAPEVGNAVVKMEGKEAMYYKMLSGAEGGAIKIIGTVGLVSGLVIALSNVAQAEPCERGNAAATEVATTVGGLGALWGLSKIPGVGAVLRNPYVAAIATGAVSGTWYGNQLMETTWAGNGMTAGQAWQTLFQDFVFRPMYAAEERKAVTW